jgi:hypothetical protein
MEDEQGTLYEASQKLHDAVMDLFLAICHELKIDVIVEWIAKLIRKVNP